MSILFNHAIRHDLYDHNPIRWVRQSAKRTKAPTVLSVSEIKSLLPALGLRERTTLVLLDACTGLRMSELFALKWSDVDFESKQMDVRRSIVNQVVGSCKTEASQKPVSLDDRFAECLLDWRAETKYNKRTTGSLPARLPEAPGLTGASPSCEIRSGRALKRSGLIGHSGGIRSGTPTRLYCDPTGQT
jgi:integrase